MSLSSLASDLFKPAFEAQTFARALVMHDEAYVAKILKHHPNAANWADATGRSALNIAVEARGLEICKLLVAASADIEHPDPATSNFRPLHRALLSNDTPIAEMLIDKGADVNARDGLSQTAFYMAVSESPVSLLQKMVGKKADINVVCDDTTPLMLAAMADNKDAIRFLIGQKADIGIKKRNGVTADQLATSREMEDFLGQAKKDYDAAHSVEAKRAAAEKARAEAEMKVVQEKMAVENAIEAILKGTQTAVNILRPLKFKRSPGL